MPSLPNCPTVQRLPLAWIERNRDLIEAQRIRLTRDDKPRKREYQKRRFQSDPVFRLRCTLRNRFRAAFKGKRSTLARRKLLGCTIPELKAHIESQFTPGMSWDNYGLWEVDHIIPCAAFNLMDSKQLSQCFSKDNLQPLWRQDNRAKGSKLKYTPVRFR